MVTPIKLNQTNSPRSPLVPRLIPEVESEEELEGAIKENDSSVEIVRVIQRTSGVQITPDMPLSTRPRNTLQVPVALFHPVNTTLLVVIRPVVPVPPIVKVPPQQLQPAINMAQLDAILDLLTLLQ